MRQNLFLGRQGGGINDGGGGSGGGGGPMPPLTNAYPNISSSESTITGANFKLGSQSHSPAGEATWNISGLGARVGRFAYSWDGMEQTPGVYTHSSASQIAQNTGINASLSAGHLTYIILSYGNSLYRDAGDPIDSRANWPYASSITGTGKAGAGGWWEKFANYAIAVIARYGTTNTIYELWNEPNGTAFGALTGLEYYNFIKAVYGPIKAAQPSAILAGPVIDDAPGSGGTACWTGLQSAGTAGTRWTNYVDKCSLHQYGNFFTNPESKFSGVLSCINGMVSPVRKSSITEMGWFTAGTYPVTLQQFKVFHARSPIIARAMQLENFVHFEVEDDGQVMGIYSSGHVAKVGVKEAWTDGQAIAYGWDSAKWYGTNPRWVIRGITPAGKHQAACWTSTALASESRQIVVNCDTAGNVRQHRIGLTVGTDTLVAIPIGPQIYTFTNTDTPLLLTGDTVGMNLTFPEYP